jgi:hypothetical protein
MKQLKYWALAIAAAILFTACNAEEQNKFRRDLLGLANARWYIVLYGVNGNEVFRGELNGKVTRADKGDDGSGHGGDYIYWFDPSGKAWQSDLPYVVTTDNNRTGVLTSPVKR